MNGFRILSISLIISVIVMIGCSQSSEHPLFDHTWSLDEQSFSTAQSPESSLNDKAPRGIQFLSDNQLLMIGRPTFVANFIYRSDSLYYQPEDGEYIHAFRTYLSSGGDTLKLENDFEERMYTKLTPPETDFELTSVTLSGFQYYSKTNPSYSFSLEESGTAVVSRLISRSTISDDPPVKLPPKDIKLDSALVEGIFALGEHISIPMKTYPGMRRKLLIVGDQQMTLSYHNLGDQSIEFSTIKDPYWLLFHRSLMSLLIEDRLQHEVFDGNPFF